MLYVFSLFSSGFNLYWWKGIHFSQNLDFIFLYLFFIFISNFWYRDLLREFYKKYEVLLIIFFLVFLLFLVSEGLLFVSFFWTSFHSLSSPSLGITVSYAIIQRFPEVGHRRQRHSIHTRLTSPWNRMPVTRAVHGQCQ